MFLRNQKFIDYTPILTTALLECGNISQLYRMWVEQTAEGQSLWGWLAVNVALWLWLNFYRVVTPEKKWAIIGTKVGIVLNSAVILSVLYFRFHP